MATVLEEIRLAQATLGLPLAALRELPACESSDLFHTILAHFVEGGDRRWWWESFRAPHTSRRISDGSGWQYLPALVPDPNELAWFLPEDDSLPHYPVLETSTANASKIVSECYAFEYYLVAKDFSCLICENHHDMLIAVGDVVEERLASVA
jgi:hypothetical protein